jgi:hypothetical protein
MEEAGRMPAKLRSRNQAAGKALFPRLVRVRPSQAHDADGIEMDVTVNC